MTFVNPAAKRIGESLKAAMRTQGISEHELAVKAHKREDHIEAVLNGFPNTTKRPTQLDTVDEIARALGLKLDLKPSE
jgi:hypothetical protein